MNARTVDLTITSVKEQDITLIARQGIEAVTATSRSFGGDATAGQGRLRPALPERKRWKFI